MLVLHQQPANIKQMATRTCYAVIADAKRPSDDEKTKALMLLEKTTSELTDEEVLWIKKLLNVEDCKLGISIDKMSEAVGTQPKRVFVVKPPAGDYMVEFDLTCSDGRWASAPWA